jgi:hypothetical protein
MPVLGDLIDHRLMPATSMTAGTNRLASTTYNQAERHWLLGNATVEPDPAAASTFSAYVELGKVAAIRPIGMPHEARIADVCWSVRNTTPQCPRGSATIHRTQSLALRVTVAR